MDTCIEEWMKERDSKREGENVEKGKEGYSYIWDLFRRYCAVIAGGVIV